MKQLKKCYNRLKLRKKIMLLSFTVSLIPILILGIFAIHQGRKLLVSREETHLHNIMEQANSKLNHFLILHDNIMNSLTWDTFIRNSVNKNYNNNYEMFLVNREIFDSKIPMVQAMHKEINEITLYTGTNLYPHNGTLDSLDKIASEPWYEKVHTTTKPFYIHNDKYSEMLLISPMLDTYYTNVFVIKISKEIMFEDYCSLFENDYAVGIYDQDGKLLFQHSQLNEMYSDFILFPNNLDEVPPRRNGKIFFSESTNKNTYGWTIVMYRPLKELTNSADSFIWIIFVIIIVCIAVISYISTKLSRQIVNPLEDLGRALEQIQADNLTVTIQCNTNDEISLLISAFNKMARRLDETINELYVNKLAKQEYRLQMLQSQINPHFLYNCLSMINSRALRCEQPEISKITLLLSTFYRTTLNKGHNTTTVHEEWRNIISYIELEKILHPTLQFDCYIDEELFSYKIINLIIQPLVENAILHGIRGKHNNKIESGKICIEGRLQHNCMCFYVCDNGCGMDQKTLSTITTIQTKGYGIRNVDQRIKLYFGRTYGISYESTLGEGTKATITLPLIVENKNKDYPHNI